MYAYILPNYSEYDAERAVRGMTAAKSEVAYDTKSTSTQNDASLDEHLLYSE
jgi:hypothetical protein